MHSERCPSYWSSPVLLLYGITKIQNFVVPNIGDNIALDLCVGCLNVGNVCK